MAPASGAAVGSEVNEVEAATAFLMSGPAAGNNAQDRVGVGTQDGRH
jgi:hypothetical protein